MPFLETRNGEGHGEIWAGISDLSWTSNKGEMASAREKTKKNEKARWATINTRETEGKCLEASGSNGNFYFLVVKYS